MDMDKLRSFAGLSAESTQAFNKLAPLVEEYAEEIEAAISEADLNPDGAPSAAEITLLRTALGEIDPDLADALADELSHGISADQAQMLAARLTVSCAMADQDAVARVFSGLAQSYSADGDPDSEETALPDGPGEDDEDDESESGDEIEPE